MRRSLAILVAAVAFASTLALGWSELRSQGDQATSASRSGTERPLATPSPAWEPEAPTRDLFAFADEASAEGLHMLAPPASPTPAGPATPDVESTPAPRARLIGFLRQAGRLEAVLALDGAVEVAAAGERRRGYLVAAVDEDALRVRIETPEGETLEVTLASAQ